MIPTTCSDCPFYQPSDRTPSVGYCCQFDHKALAHDIPSDGCHEAIAAFADTPQPANAIAFIERGRKRWHKPDAPAPFLRLTDGRVLELARDYRQTWHVSIQHPQRQFLGKIEQHPHGGWVVVSVDRRPHFGREQHPDYSGAVAELLRLAAGATP